MLFSELVKTVRQDLSFSQEQIARELNISFSTVNRWENGKTQPSNMAKDIFYAFCESKNIDIETYMKEGAPDD